MRKHIVCFGDSNTHGYCADPQDCADHGTRFNEEERWPCLLQKKLGDACLVIEEGLSGRTTVLEDPLNEGLSGLSVLAPVLLSHEPVDLLIIMLGTNDTKERFGMNAWGIAAGLERLVQKAKTLPVWGARGPEILLIAPPPIGEGVRGADCICGMGPGCVEKSRGLAAEYRQVAQRQGCAFMDAAGIGEFNRVDFMHLTRRGHERLAEAIAALPCVEELFR